MNIYLNGLAIPLTSALHHFSLSLFLGLMSLLSNCFGWEMRQTHTAKDDPITWLLPNTFSPLGFMPYFSHCVGWCNQQLSSCQKHTKARESTGRRGRNKWHSMMSLISTSHLSPLLSAAPTSQWWDCFISFNAWRAGCTQWKRKWPVRSPKFFSTAGRVQYKVQFPNTLAPGFTF